MHTHTHTCSSTADTFSCSQRLLYFALNTECACTCLNCSIKIIQFYAFGDDHHLKEIAGQRWTPPTWSWHPAYTCWWCRTARKEWGTNPAPTRGPQALHSCHHWCSLWTPAREIRAMFTALPLLPKGRINPPEQTHILTHTVGGPDTHYTHSISFLLSWCIDYPFYDVKGEKIIIVVRQSCPSKRLHEAHFSIILDSVIA